MENILTPREATGPALSIDLSRDAIPADHLAIALSNAARDPDGQVYPWRAGYPLVGATVQHDGQLWLVASKERGPGADEPVAIVQLIGEGHDGRATATREELRPITWTAGHELALELSQLPDFATPAGGGR